MKNKVTFFVITVSVIFSCRKSDIDINPPLSPTNLKASTKSTTQIDLSWTDNSTNEDGFKIERKTSTEAYKEIATINKDITTYSDQGLTKATAYTYRVYAYNNGGKSVTYTNEATATTLDDMPSAAINLKAETKAYNQINLSWEDKASNETGYKVERKTINGNYTVIASIASNSTNYIDNGLNSKTTYSYRVYPYNISGNATYSNEAIATTDVNIVNLTWSQINSGKSIRVISNLDSSILFLSKVNEVLKSTDNGINWTSTNFPAGITNDYGCSYSTFNGGQLAIGTNSSGYFLSNDNGNSYSQSGPTGFGCGSFFIMPTDDGRFIGSMTGFQRGIYKSSGIDNKTWINKYQGIDPRGIARVANTYYIAAGGTVFFKSVDNGDSWSSISINQYSNDLISIADTLFWINENSKLYRANVNSLTSESLVYDFAETNLNLLPRITYYSKYNVIIVNMPTRGVFLSNNGGRNWYNYKLPGVSGYYTCSIIKDKIYVCTDIGLFVSNL